jgi:hypothetical protein
VAQVGHRAHELRSDGRHSVLVFVVARVCTVKSEQKASLEKASAEGNRRESKVIGDHLAGFPKSVPLQRKKNQAGNKSGNLSTK